MSYDNKEPRKQPNNLEVFYAQYRARRWRKLQTSKIGRLGERLAVVNHGWQSESTDGPTGAWGLLSFYLFLSLSPSFSRFLSLSLTTYLSIYPSIHLSTYLSLSLSPSLSLCLSVCLFIYLQSLKTKLFCEASTEFLHLTPFKMKLFCEASLIFAPNTMQNVAILRDVLSRWIVECRADGLVPMRFTCFVFPLHLSLSLSRSLSLSLLFFPTTAFHLSILSEVWLLDTIR